MEHAINLKIEQPGSRVGFHYFQDHDHYRLEDLQFWVPKLKALGAAWVVLKGEISQAIPEEFISGLKKEKIELSSFLPKWDCRIESIICPTSSRAANNSGLPLLALWQ